jgi:hypothetical protein
LQDWDALQLLWFPLLKYWIRQVEQGTALNRQQRRHLKQLNSKHGGFWVVAIDRTQWKQHNVFMASVIWGTHALPLYFEQIDHRGNSALVCQKRLIKQALRLFKSKKYPVLILGDREFHSPKLADWLASRNISFCLRQRKSLHFKTRLEAEYETVGSQGFQPGQSRFYTQVFCNKEDGIGPLNLAVYWKRRYRGKGPKEPWYILTNLPQLPLALSLYRARWGIEQMFKDMKTSGYHLENTLVNRYYQAEGWPIGSGDVESLVKQINQRTKLSGAAWNPERVPKVLAHRCAYLNGMLAPQRYFSL